MNRPYIICHILSALDGKITGPYMGTYAAQAVSEDYARIRSEYCADAWLYGAKTTQEFTAYRKPVLDDYPDSVPGGDFVAQTDAQLYYVSVDTQANENQTVESADYQSVEGTQIKMSTDNAEVIITLNASRAAADLVAMLPLEMTLIERESFAKGMTLPATLSSEEATTREYRIGDFGYWDAGPDLAIFYDDIYEQTIVEVIPLGHAETGAATLANETGIVRLERTYQENEVIPNE